MQLENHYKAMLAAIGEDITRSGLEKTPQRAATAMKALTEGYHQDINEIVNDAIFESDMSEMVVVNNIELTSLCEHHLLPFLGKCHVAYIPEGKIIGLSKIPRIVNLFARRLQVQERLTSQIAQCLMDVTNAEGVGVIIEARHLCMRMRGVQDQTSSVKTSMMLGSFRDDSRTRSEFLSLSA